MFISLTSYFPNFQNVFNFWCICTFNIFSPIFGCDPKDRSERFLRNVSTYVPSCNTDVGVVQNKQSVCVIYFLSRLQLIAAKIISAIYGLLMMAVLVGILLQIITYSPLAPSSLFFFIVVGVIIIAAFLHPQEIGCLLSGVVFFVTVPSMHLLLIVYAIFNLNVVSWGTREVATKKSKMVRHFL